MKLWLMEYLRCPTCRGRLALTPSEWRAPAKQVPVSAPRCTDPTGTVPVTGHPRACIECVGFEVMSGTLSCGPCEVTYPVRDGVARLASWGSHDLATQNDLTHQTALRYGYLWRRHPSRNREDRAANHFERLAEALQLPEPSGDVLDAGCGNGGDLTRLGASEGVSVVGLELSDGGCAASAIQSSQLLSVDVVQGEIGRMAFADNRFDLVYAYGLLHHLPDARRGMWEMVRVTKPGGRVVIYLYENVRERSRGWALLLAVANSLRRVTVRLPPSFLYGVCVIGASFAYVWFVLPYRLLRRFQATRVLAEQIPFRHGRSPFSLAPDLYDRFAAPIERRFTRQEALAFCAEAGLQDLTIVNTRGWTVSGTKPSEGCP